MNPDNLPFFTIVFIPLLNFLYLPTDLKKKGSVKYSDPFLFGYTF